jgi:hypothetical protein
MPTRRAIARFTGSEALSIRAGNTQLERTMC